MDKTSASVLEHFPENLREVPEVVSAAEIIAHETKPNLAEAASQAFPAAYPTIRRAMTEPVAQLRKDFAIALAGSFLGIDANYPTTTNRPIESARSIARAFAEELRISRLEQQAMAAAARQNEKIEAKAGTQVVRRIDGSVIPLVTFLASVSELAIPLIQDHERVHGRPASTHEKRAAVRAARADVLGGYTKAETRTIVGAANKRARKAQARLARSGREPRFEVG